MQPLSFSLVQIAFVLTLWATLAAMAALFLRKRLANLKLRGKIQLHMENSNTGQCWTEYVPGSLEGYQVPQGPFVKFEGNYAKMDRDKMIPTFHVNLDTGALVKPALGADGQPSIITARHGESQELDGYIMAASMQSNDIERFQDIERGPDWAKLSFVVGVVLIFLVLIVGFFVTKITGGVA